jgi:hypothetical protein
MNLRKSLQAMASLSSPQFDANPFLRRASMCPIYQPESPSTVAGTMAPARPLCESKEYSGQLCATPIDLEVSF